MLATIYGTANVELARRRWAGSPRYAAQRLSRAIDDQELIVISFTCTEHGMRLQQFKSTVVNSAIGQSLEHGAGQDHEAR